MKNYLLLFIVCISQNMFSQNIGPENVSQQIIYAYSNVDVKPEFNGGVAKMYEFIGANYKIPESKKEIKTKVSVFFVVENDGSISNVKGVRNDNIDLVTEAIRIVKMFPKWKPGEKNGEKVRVSYSLPISIN